MKTLLLSAMFAVSACTHRDDCMSACIDKCQKTVGPGSPEGKACATRCIEKPLEDCTEELDSEDGPRVGGSVGS